MRIAKQIFRHRIFALLFGLSSVFAFPLFADAVTIKPSIVGGKNLTVGDRFFYVDTVSVSPGDTLLPLPPAEGKLGDAEIVSQLFGSTKPIPGKRVFACSLAVFKPGEAKIPTFNFRKTNNLADTTIYFGDTLTVQIKSVLPPDTTGLSIADIRGPKRLRGPLWPYIVFPLLLALLIFGLIMLRRKMRGKVSEPSIPPIPPWELAIQKLDALKAERHLEFGKFKQFYFELSLIIRGYIESRYDTPAVESTTYELEDNAILKTIPNELYNRLFEFFLRADLVKFAKSIPTTPDAESDLSFAYDFVDSTKPAPAPLAASLTVPEEVKA
jgi:hypothetical protein